MDYFVASPSTDFLDPQLQGSRPSGTPVPTILSRRAINARSPMTGTTPIIGALTDNAQKFTICGFLPLPSITASPVCTPTTSISSINPLSEAGSSIKSPEEFTTAPSSPCMQVAAPPTWISTPPTPPPRSVRRSATCLTQISSPLSPSASFPASSIPHETGYFIKRCASVPSMSPRPRASPYGSRRAHSRDGYCSSVVITSPLQATLISMPNDATKSSSKDFDHLMIRSRPIFHIPHDIPTDTEDASPRMTESPEHMNEEMSGEGSWSDNDSDDTWHSEKAKDDIRKYHALKELLATEVGYLLDLRALVTVYLRLLPTLVCRTTLPTTFGRASSSFTSSPWVNSYSHAHAAALSSSATLLDPSGSHSLASINTKEQTKSVPRYLFTDHEVEILTRNAEGILQLHEHFVRELRAEMMPLGFHMEVGGQPEDPDKHQQQALQNTDAAIRAVSTKFATEASRFSSYQTFCTGHPEALDLVRKIHSQHPLEWDAFEHRCSSLVHELELSTPAAPESSEHAASSEEIDSPPVNTAVTKKRSRAASLSSIDGPIRTLRSRASNLVPKDTVSFPTDVARKDKAPPRLAFVDYLIKPVQRICKYPLVLDQLKPGKSIRAISPAHLRSEVDVVVESAAQAMRHVARAVDEARHRQDVAMQSSLIVSRISLAGPTISHMSSMYSAFQALTPSFLSSLGTCLLAGSLDVIHYHAAKPSSSNITAKYLGAFLYLGGYLILAKVSKGKIYEPKHWFSFADFDICDVEEDDAMLPCSIRISSKEHRFELAASCQREKDAWLSSIRESRNHQPSWINEPTSSLRFDGKGELISSALGDGPFELVNALPTIQSIPELANSSECPELTESLFTAFNSDMRPKKSPKHDFAAWRQDPDPPSRRSSTASVKAIFSPMSSDSETIVIRRSSPSARSRVDQGLQDVISQPCLTARSFASIREEELFQVPKSTRAGFVRSQSGLSMASMAKSRLSRHESVRVLRRKSLIDGSDVVPAKKQSTGQLPPSKRQSRNISITAMSGCDILTPVSPNSSSLPSPFSATSMTSSIQTSLPRSPVHSSTFLGSAPPPKISTPIPEAKVSLKTSRSLVNNVKGLFQLRSPSTASLPHPQTPDAEPRIVKSRTPGSIRRWARGSLHRRTRSAPDVPEEPFTLPDIHKLPAMDFGTPISLSRSSNTPYEHIPSRLSNDRPSPRKPLLSSSAFCISPVEANTNHGAKHMSLLQRLKA